MLRQTLTHKSCCKQLILKRKGLSDEDSKTLEQFLVENQGIESIDLGFNKLGPKCMEGFSKFPQKNKWLKVLSIEMNDLTLGGQECGGMIAFIKSLKEDSVLMELNLAGCSLNDECIIALQGALEINKSLLHADLSRNEITPELLSTIDAQLSHNRAWACEMREKELVEIQAMEYWDQVSGLFIKQINIRASCQQAIERARMHLFVLENLQTE
jgi:hypothetical protein